MTGIFKSISGMMQLQLTSADPSDTIQNLIKLGIQLYEMNIAEEVNLTFLIRRSDYSAVCKYAQKQGINLSIRSKQGLFWSLYAMLGRPVLAGGLLLCLALFMFLPTRIFVLVVQGNVTVPSRLILEEASACGIRFGVSAREVRSEKMKNGLLSRVPQLQWAGINTYGSRAVISVRERSQEQEHVNHAGVSSVVADRDGIILSCTVSSGNPLVAPGQVVQAGQILISGYTDCGLSIEATRAEGEIFAITRRELTVKTPSYQQNRGDQIHKTQKFSLLIGKKRINFYKGSGISDASCVKMYSKYVLTLPGGFTLPLALISETVTQYETAKTLRDEETLHIEMAQFAVRYLRSQMIAGSITQQITSFSGEDGFTMNGQYECQEMIGRVRPEQIGVYNGKTD